MRVQFLHGVWMNVHVYFYEVTLCRAHWEINSRRETHLFLAVSNFLSAVLILRQLEEELRGAFHCLSYPPGLHLSYFYTPSPSNAHTYKSAEPALLMRLDSTLWICSSYMDNRCLVLRLRPKSTLITNTYGMACHVSILWFMVCTTLVISGQRYIGIYTIFIYQQFWTWCSRLLSLMSFFSLLWRVWQSKTIFLIDQEASPAVEQFRV